MSEETGKIGVVPAVVFKRIEQVRSELLDKLEKMAKSMNDNFRDFLPRIHESNIQALLANRNSVATRHFLYDKKLIDKKEFIDFSDNNDFVRTFNREIEVLQALINDIAVVDNKNYVELDFLKEKNTKHRCFCQRRNKETVCSIQKFNQLCRYSPSKKQIKTLIKYEIFRH